MTQRCAKIFFFPTHDDSYHLNNYQSLYSFIRRHACWEIHKIRVFFLKERIYEWARRDSGNRSNDMKHNVSEREDLRASFEYYYYSNLVSGVLVSLSLKMYSLLFYNVVWSGKKCRPIRARFNKTLLGVHSK